MNRRRFIDGLSKLFGGVTGLLFAAPIVAYFLPKPSDRGSNLVTTPNGDAIPPDSIQKEGSRIGLAFGEPTLVIYDKGEWKAFNAVCPHLGCIVRWQKQEGKILCPCHAARFDTNGNVISGPPPKPLKQYRVEIADNSVRLYEA